MSLSWNRLKGYSCDIIAENTNKKLGVPLACSMRMKTQIKKIEVIQYYLKKWSTASFFYEPPFLFALR